MSQDDTTKRPEDETDASATPPDAGPAPEPDAHAVEEASAEDAPAEPAPADEPVEPEPVKPTNDGGPAPWVREADAAAAENEPVDAAYDEVTLDSEPAPEAAKDDGGRGVSLPMAVALSGIAAVTGGALGTVFSGDGGGTAPAEVAALERRIDTLQTALDSAAASDAGGAGVAVGVLQAEADALGDRITALEDGLDEAIAAASRRRQPGGGSALDADALARLDALESAVDLERLSALENEVRAARSLANRTREAGEDLRDDLEATLGDLESRIALLDDTDALLATRVVGVDATEAVANGKTAAAALAYADLRELIGDGAPYANALERASAHFAPDEGLELLAPHAGAGAPLIDELVADFRGAARAARRAEQGDRGFWARLFGVFGGSVERSDGEGPSTAARDVVRRAGIALEAGDVAGAASAMASMNEDARAAAQYWIDKANAHVEARDGLAAMAASLGVEQAG